MPSPLTVHGYKADFIHSKISLLIHNLISITDTTGEFLQHLPDGRTIDTKGWHDWEWTHGIGLYGLYQYSLLLPSMLPQPAPDPSKLPLPLPYLDPATIIKAWFTEQLPRSTTKNINTMSVFLTLAYLYSASPTSNHTYRPWLESWASWAMHSLPRTVYGGFQHTTYSSFNANELWDDTLMMTVLPLAAIGKVLNRTEYVEEAKRQTLLHVQYLLDVRTGLWFHGWKFDDAADGGVGHHFARARWARGNAWVTMFVPDFLELLDLPAGDALHVHLVGVLQAQCKALKRLQADDGMWRTLLDVAASEGSYPEASATAGIAYGMLKGVRKRYLGEEYEEVAWKAVRAVIGNVSEEGELLNVSFGTAMGENLQHYKDIPLTSMPYGQAMAMMMLGECLRAFI